MKIRPNGRNIYLKTIDIKLYNIIDTKKECTFIIFRFIPSILCLMIHCNYPPSPPLTLDLRDTDARITEFTK